MQPLMEGWIWKNNCFIFGEEQFRIDIEESSYTNDQARMTREITKAMCSLVGFLKFTGEDFTEFGTRLPTLDTELWVTDEWKVGYCFYEKPTVPNRVLDRLTALLTSSLN